MIFIYIYVALLPHKTNQAKTIFDSKEKLGVAPASQGDAADIHAGNIININTIENKKRIRMLIFPMAIAHYIDTKLECHETNYS